MPNIIIIVMKITDADAKSTASFDSSLDLFLSPLFSTCLTNTTKKNTGKALHSCKTIRMQGKKQKEYTMGFQVRMARKKASHPHLNCLLVSSCRRGARPTLPNYVQTMFAFSGLYPLGYINTESTHRPPFVCVQSICIIENLSLMGSSESDTTKSPTW